MYSSRKNVCNTCQTHFKESSRHNVKCCSACEQVYYCSYECKSSHRPDTYYQSFKYHSSLECNVLQQLKYPLRVQYDDDDILVAKLLIRIICAREHDPDPSRYETFMLLSDHIPDYDEKKWEEMNVLWELIRELEGEEHQGVFSEPKDEIMGILSKIRSNFFGVWSMSGRQAVWSGASIYLRCSFFNHSCFPNCLVAQESKPTQQQLDRNNVGAVFTVRSVCDIEVGEELCLSYIPLDQPTQRRRMHLTANWMFTCQCVRCVDPDADAKPIDAFSCPDRKCAGGLLVPEVLLEDGEREGMVGWCRLCNSSAVLPSSAERKAWFKPTSL